MKLLILSLSLFVLTFAAPPPEVLDDKIHIPEKCEDVLSVKVCQKLTDAARNLKLTKYQVKEAVVNAVKNGKTKAEEIYNSAKDFLQQKVLSKKCEDFTSADTCAKLRALAGKLKVASDKVEEFVIKAVAEGAIKATDLYNKVVEYYKTEIATKTCEDFLSKSQCERIRQVASALKIKAGQLEKTIVDAVTKAYIEGKDALQSTFEKLKDLAKNTSCEDLLNPGVCTTLRKYAQLTKVAFPTIMDVVRDAIVKGYKLGKGLLKAIYSVTDYFYDCEDVFTKSSCDRLKYWLGKLGVKVAQIDQIVREYAKKGIAKASELYKKIYDFLKDKVICKINPWCKSSSVVKRGIVTDLINDIKKALEKAIVATQAKIDDYLKKLAVKVKDSSDKMVKAVEEMLLKMKMSAADVAKFLKEIFEKKSGNGTATDVRITKRDLYEKLQEALKNAHGYVKAMIQNLMTMSKEHLKKIHGLIKSIFESLLDGGKTKREIDEVDMMEEIVEKMIDEEFSEFEIDAEDDVDEVIDEIILEGDENEMIEKRDLTSVIDKMKGAYKKFGEKFKELLEKVKGINVEQLKEMLKKAGSNMLGSVKDLYEKVKAMLEKQVGGN